MSYTLYNGIKIPKIGFGTWQIPKGEVCYNAVLEALKAGYRHIDTAFVYENEVSVGDAIKASNINRTELFITTKLPANVKTYDGCIKHFYESLENLGLDYIDLYLIHAPWPWENVGSDCTKGNIEAWKAMIDLYNKGLVKSIGVSNFHKEDIIPLYEATNVYPMVNQIRFFIGNTQRKIVDFCKENNILVEAYSPFATGGMLDNEEIIKIANKHNTTPNKICLAYCYYYQTLPLPKSTNKERIIDNLTCNVKLDQNDLDILDNFIIEERLKRKLRS